MAYVWQTSEQTGETRPGLFDTNAFSSEFGRPNREVAVIIHRLRIRYWRLEKPLSQPPSDIFRQHLRTRIFWSLGREKDQRFVKNMCYYARTDYSCGDWKWGNMKLRCPRQHRIGETCGAKLVHEESVEKVDEPCRKCTDIETKKRRLRRELDNIDRWKRDGNKFIASIEKAQREAKALERQIQDINAERVSVQMNRQAGGLGVGPGYSTTGSGSPGYHGLQGSSHAESSASRHSSTVQGGYSTVSGYAYAGASSHRHHPAYGQETAFSPCGHHGSGY